MLRAYCISVEPFPSPKASLCAEPLLCAGRCARVLSDTRNTTVSGTVAALPQGRQANSRRAINCDNALAGKPCANEAQKHVSSPLRHGSSVFSLYLWGSGE